MLVEAILASVVVSAAQPTVTPAPAHPTTSTTIIAESWEDKVWRRRRRAS
ncbi:hypothetical protein PN499_23325 [Kamptonema animale CS-326]|nr:hypothetical protein [Kamptonema animale]MDB9514137.1 hypothetical protein [Kamptonema animale CS-326]